MTTRAVLKMDIDSILRKAEKYINISDGPIAVFLLLFSLLLP